MTDQPLPDIRPAVPHGARIWNYWLGGTDNHGADREIAQPERIVEQAREILDFSQPIAVLFMGVFGYVPDYDEARSIISRVVDAVPSGSYLALWDGTSTSEAVVRGAQAQGELGSPYALRTVDEIRGWFAGTELVEPGVVPVTRWRPADVEVGQAEHIDAYCGVGRKP